MKVRILFFGMIAEALETNVYSIENYHGQTIADLETHLKERYPRLNDFTYQIALNQVAVNHNAGLQAVNEVAILPPFAGG
jgi:molybdopterin synthase sulfur carrier subunit